MSNHSLSDQLQVCWVFWNFINFLFFAKKSKQTNMLMGQYILWQVWPLILIVVVTETYFRQRRLRWLGKRWFVIGLILTWALLANRRGRFAK